MLQRLDNNISRRYYQRQPLTICMSAVGNIVEKGIEASGPCAESLPRWLPRAKSARTAPINGQTLDLGLDILIKAKFVLSNRTLK